MWSRWPQRSGPNRREGGNSRPDHGVLPMRSASRVPRLAPRAHPQHSRPRLIRSPDLEEARVPLARYALPIGDFRRRTRPHRAGGKLTLRAFHWADEQLKKQRIAVAAIARQLGVYWHTIWKNIMALVHLELAAHRLPRDRVLTGCVDHTTDTRGRIRARLLDLVPGRSDNIARHMQIWVILRKRYPIYTG